LEVKMQFESAPLITVVRDPPPIGH